MANVGDTVIIDNIECLVIYDAGSAQSWGRYILVDKNHDLSFYVNGSDWVDSSYYEYSPGTFGYEWGGYNTETGITNIAVGTGLSNTNALIGMSLSPLASGWRVVWDKVQDFRSSYSNSWFVPSKDELNLVYQQKANLTNISTSGSYYYWSSSESSFARVWRQSFNSGTQLTNNKNNRDTHVRLCRYTVDEDLETSFINAPSIISITVPSGAIVRYTTDGVDPTESSAVYSSSFSVSPGTLVKARAFQSGKRPSNIVSIST